MKRLLKRRAVQEGLEQAEQEMGGTTLTYSELCDFFSEEGIVTPTAIEQSTRQISSDEHTRFLLVRDLKKKALESTKQEVKIEKIEEVPEEEDEKPSTSTKKESGEGSPLGTEFDEDLAKALSMSMEETKVYDEKDYEYDSDQELRLNRAQSKQLRHAAKGPARAYMIEYGGMNDEEVGNILEATQLDDTQSLEKLLDLTTVPAEMANDSIEEAKLISQAIEESKQLAQAIEESKKSLKEDKVEIVDTDTDSDLEEVMETQEPVKGKKTLEICVDITEDLKDSNDLFADIFEEEVKELENKKKTESDEDDDFIEVKDSEEMVLDSQDDATPNEDKSMPETNQLKENIDEIIEVKDSQELIPSEVKNKPDLDSILSELKKETAAVKNIQLNVTEEAEHKPKVELSSILDELKTKMAEVKNISLDQVKLSNSASIVLSSDDEGASKNTKTTVLKEEVIELCDRCSSSMDVCLSSKGTPLWVDLSDKTRMNP